MELGQIAFDETTGFYGMTDDVLMHLRESTQRMLNNVASASIIIEEIYSEMIESIRSTYNTYHIYSEIRGTIYLHKLIFLEIIKQDSINMYVKCVSAIDKHQELKKAQEVHNASTNNDDGLRDMMEEILGNTERLLDIGMGVYTDHSDDSESQYDSESESEPESEPEDDDSQYNSEHDDGPEDDDESQYDSEPGSEVADVDDPDRYRIYPILSLVDSGEDDSQDIYILPLPMEDDSEPLNDLID